MDQLSLSEAQLFRLLTSFFGEERVVFGMSVFAVCGGLIPEVCRDDREFLPLADLEKWAKTQKCLFTVVDADESPRLVLEFEESFNEVVDLERLEHFRYLEPLLEAASVRYVPISHGEFSEILSNDGRLDLYSLLRDKLGVDIDCSDGP